jgi:hypothetical protein
MKWILAGAAVVLVLVGGLCLWGMLALLASGMAERCPVCGCQAMVETGKKEMTCGRCGVVVEEVNGEE